jgi:hypothetical protein
MLSSHPDKTRALLVRNYLYIVLRTAHMSKYQMGLDKSGLSSTVQVPSLLYIDIQSNIQSTPVLRIYSARS